MKRTVNLDDSNLDTDLNILTNEILHELYILWRKAGIYTTGHPLVKKASGRPFMCLQKLFGFKKYLAITLTEGRLFINNIMMREAVNAEFLKENMHELEIKSLLISDSITSDELLLFSDRFVRRVPVNNPDHNLENYLKNHSINSVLINSPLAEKIFSRGLRYRSDVSDDFSVRRLVSNYFAGDINQTVEMLSGNYDNTAEQAEDTGIDFHREIVGYILPEKFAQLPHAELIEAARQRLEDYMDDPQKGKEILGKLVKSFDYHPDRGQLLGELKKLLAVNNMDDGMVSQAMAVSGVVSSATTALDKIEAQIFSADFKPEYLEHYRECFKRVLRTRQMGRAGNAAQRAAENLIDSDADFRQHAVYMIKDQVQAAQSLGEFDFLEAIIRQLQNLFTRGANTFEFAESSSYLLKTILGFRRYESAAEFLNLLKIGRTENESIVTYESAAIKRIFESLNDHEIISRLVREIQYHDNKYLKNVRDILVAIRSEEVAVQLADIVTHPDRHIRQRCLRILSELGRPAVTIFSEIIRDEQNFYREDDRYELPDKKWYLIRNAIFVLGNLGDPFACSAFRMRLSDPDVRVRLEIIKAVEKIANDDAVDLLMILTEDIDPALQEKAIIALGAMQKADLVPFFVDLLPRHKAQVQRLIRAIAQTRCEEGRNYLIHLLNEREAIRKLSSGKASPDDIKRMILLALEKFGDDKTKSQAEEYLEKGHISLFDGERSLGKTAKILINKIQLKK